jgi:alkanesulfonate monooxygenase SsuD/methylene tetrahydromethanopterin reductase-like flavin-dependent oxidoreductase (luciferase family)
MEMASIGRPILIGIEAVDTLQDRLKRYGDTMLGAGFSEDKVEAALDETWCQRGLYVTETDEEAEEPARVHLKRYRDFIMEARVKYNPGSVLAPDPKSPVNPNAGKVSARDQYEHAFLAGSPKRVSEQLAELRDAGVRNLMLNVNVGEMPQDKVEASMKLFGEKVLPKFT